MNSEKIWPMEEKYQEYLIDESKYSGYADSISFPENEKDILEIVKRMKENHKDITIQGGKTGIVGGAVPRGGHIINLSRMNQWKEARL
ncbi:MAG: FAD-binding protein, partial [Lachnospiraceae bacterium]